MNSFKFDAFLKEFPFLKRRARKVMFCDSIQVKRLGKELLEFVPREMNWDGSLVFIRDWQAVDFICDDGEYIVDAVRPHVAWGSNYAYEGRGESEGETLLEALSRLEDVQKVKYILITEAGYNIQEHHSKDNWRMTIYKVGKGENIQNIIDATRSAAANEVRAEANF